MELNAVDQLPVVSLDHHLILAEIGRSEQLKACRNANNLNAVILPYAQDVVVRRVFLPNAGPFIIVAFKYRI